MLVCVTTIDSVQQQREFSCWAENLETTLNALSGLTLNGAYILDARLVDNSDHSIQLPPELFNGSSFSAAFQQVENQWQQILNQA